MKPWVTFDGQPFVLVNLLFIICVFSCYGDETRMGLKALAASAGY